MSFIKDGVSDPCRAADLGPVEGWLKLPDTDLSPVIIKSSSAPSSSSSIASRGSYSPSPSSSSEDDSTLSGAADFGPLPEVLVGGSGYAHSRAPFLHPTVSLSVLIESLGHDYLLSHVG